MATVAPVFSTLSSDPEVTLITWTLTSADTTGVAVSLPQHRDMCWQATGTWGGATAAAQASNTNTDGLFGAHSNLNGGTAITYTADGAPKQALERALFLRPKLTTAGAGATVVVTLLLCKTPRY